MTIGVLALQGAFAEHEQMLERLGESTFEIRQRRDLERSMDGLIIENDARIHSAAMDITAVRNAYGRQLGSFHTEANFAGAGKVPMTFIRAPYIASCSGAARPLAEVDGKIVAARENHLLVTAFHPELDENPTVHTYFLNMIRKKG